MSEQVVFWCVAKRVPVTTPYGAGIAYVERAWPLDRWTQDVRKASCMPLKAAYSLARRAGASVVLASDASSHWRDICAHERMQSHLDIAYQPAAAPVLNIPSTGIVDALPREEHLWPACKLVDLNAPASVGA